MTKRGDAPDKSSSGDFALSRSGSKIDAIDIFVRILTYAFGELGFFLFVFGEASRGRKYVCNVQDKRIQMTTGAVPFQHLANE